MPKFRRMSFSHRQISSILGRLEVTKLRKIRKYVLLTFAVALCLKIRSNSVELNNSIDEYSPPSVLFANGTTFAVNIPPRISDSGSNKGYSNLKHPTSGVNQAIKTNDDYTPSVFDSKQQTFNAVSSTASGTASGTDVTSEKADDQRTQNPFLNQMTEEEKREAARNQFRGRRRGKMAAFNHAFNQNKFEDVTRNMNVAARNVQKRTFPVSHDIDAVENSLNETDRDHLSLQIQKLNDQQLIYNSEIYGPLKQTDTVVLVQVHNRLKNLRILVKSLIEARNISSCLVIFSHDFFDENMNDFIRNITEFRVMQIFFPFSIQLYPNKFPGRDPRDCAWNHNKQEGSKKVQCLNEKWTDTFGHYREATFTQIKHHWWWKFLRVFKELRETRNFEGPVLFLEEDHFVSPDIFHTLHLINELRNENTELRKYLVLGLGNYLKVVGKTEEVFKAEWIVNKFNMGFVLDRRAFDIIHGCSFQFCHYDDYNWDWTLATIASNCAQNRLAMLYPAMSRVFHIGSCGTHYRGTGCDLDKEVRIVRNRLNSYSSWLFPSKLAVSGFMNLGVRRRSENGGWGDHRDHLLCLAMTNGTASETMKKLSLNKS